jgi:amino acid adenylation domain-containing protein
VTEPAVRPGLGRGTLGGLLRARALERPHQVAFTFLADGEVEGERLTYAGLEARARAVAAALGESVPPGERALLLFPPGLDFIAAFFGCLYAGVVAVPAYPPRPNDRSQSRLRAMAGDAEPRAALTTLAILAGAEGSRGLLSLAPELAGLRWIPTDMLTDAGTGEDLPEPDPEAIAFLQYTSGSTAAPKGVTVTHANLLHNERMIGAAFEQDEDSVVVSWLPLYHDMGLIGGVLQPLHAGARCVLMSPVAFLQKPLRWLAAISRYRGTTSGGPNFAYDLCARRIGPEEREGLDLSSWRVAFNGAEPVRAGTLERFAEAFAPCGFRREAFYPCYGLAEATLFVTGGVPGRRPRVEEDPAGRRLVSCGRPWMGQRVVIADPETGTEQPPGVEGEVWVCGPSVARGYWRRDEETARDFNAFLPGSGEGPFLRTGDLGFLHEGELFVTGRLKDLIILRGRNHYPQDVELTAERSHPDLRPGNGAAFSVETGGEERLVVVHEVERRRREGLEEVAEAVRRAVAEEHEAQVHEVVLIRAGSLPKTSSGKVQRRLCRDLYLRGELAVVARSALAGRDAALESGVALTRGALAALEPEERRAMLEAFLRERAAAALGVAPEAISPEQPLTGLGLDSLAAVELKGSVETALGMEAPLTDLLQGVGVQGLAERLLERLAAGPGEAEVQPLRALSLEGDQDLSPGEKALWFLHRLAPEGGAYNIAVAARVRGLDPAALERALRILAARHESLRTVFPLAGDGPVRRVLPAVEIDFRVEDASGWSERELADRLGADAWRPFPVETGPLLRGRVFDRSGGEQVLLFAIHHLVADFWSLGVVARELAVLYHQGEALAPLPLRAADAVRWQEKALAGSRGERLWSYWRECLDGIPDLDLPTDRPRPPVQTYRGSARSLVVPSSMAAGVRALAAAHGTTSFMALLALFQALLGRWSRQEDFAVGSPTAGRPAPEMANLVGYFVNPVALRAGLSGDPAFADHLDRVRRVVLEGLEHAAFPFALLAERLRPSRDAARPPIFQTMFVLQRGRPQDDPGLAAFALGEEGARVPFGALTLESIRLEERRAQVDLALRLAETPGGELLASLEFNADLFDPASAEGMLRQLRSLLAGAIEEPERRIGELPWMEEAEARQVLRWSTGPEATASLPALHELVREQAERAPGTPALVWDGGGMSYGELASRARTLALGLRRLGVGPDVVIGLLAERSPEMVVGMLGVLEAGGAWLPLDPELPRERLAAMVEDAGVPLVLAPRRLLATVPPFAGRVLALESLEAHEGELPRVEGDNLAYVIFTSGSTGRPKGVAVPHRAVVNRLLRAREAFAIGPSDSMLQRAPFGFDVSVWEVFGPLVAGARVVLLPPGGHRDPAVVTHVLVEGKVTLANFTPSALDVLLDREDLAVRALSLRQVFVGAEALTADLRDRFFAALPSPLTNMYGPTEAAIDLVWHTCRPEDGARVPIGRPIPGCAAYVLDAFFAAVPPGVPGELWLGGEALARGYLGRPDLTAERFLPNPFGDGERLYRTGDLARWLPEGSLEFLGRVDEQVKIRGVRVEPGEVEAALRRQPDVREAAVLVREGRLVAYVVAPAADPRALRAALEEVLPEAMIPTAFVPVPELPRTPSGKLDRRALADIEPEHGAAGAGYAPPRTPVEELLAGLWAELLGVERVGVHDDFFELGGHSLLATRLVARISLLFGVELPVSALFLAPAVARLAEKIAAAPPAPPMLPAARDGGPLPLSFAQGRLWLLDRIEPGNPAYNIPGAVRLSGPLDLGALAGSLAEIVRRHEALRTVFRTERGRPVQVVRSPETRLPLVDLGALPSALRESESERLARLEATASFDLARGPLHRMLVLQLAPGEHLLAITLHHIVADGWSLAVLLGELASLYDALTAGRPSPLPPLSVQYADWASWQREHLQGDVLERQLSWWRERLADVPVLEVPADRPRPPVRSFRGAHRSVLLPPGLSLEIEKLSRREGVTLFMALLAVFQTLLARTTGEDLIPVGSPVANRGRVETEGLIGFFVNTLVLTADMGDDPPFRDLLARVREVCLGAYAHQDLPFERLVEELRPERHLSQNPLFQVVFLLEESLPAPRLGDLAAEVTRVETGTAKFDLTLAVSRGERGLAATLEHDTALFDPATVDRLLGHWRTLIEGIAADPGTRISALPLLTAAELEQVLGAWSGTAAPYPREAAIHELFESGARRAPDAVALEIGDERLTYGELDVRANRLARRLRRAGVGLETAVGLLVERSAALIVGMLGILKAGGAYVPLDPSHPGERLAFMAGDAGLGAVVTQSHLAGRIAATVLLDAGGELDGGPQESGDPLSPLAGGGHLAYVMYTSGSTGRPKGVEVPHRAVVRLVRGTGYARFGRWEVFLHLAPASFDAATFEIWGALLHGARLAVFPGRAATLDELAATIARHGVTTLWLTAGLFHKMVESRLKGLGGVSQLLAGGDVLSPEHVRRALAGLPGCTVINGYGPTENTTFTSCHPMRDPAEVETPVSIGSPVANTRVLLLDRGFRPVAAGVPGELFAAGDGLARGYRNRPDLTAERFVPNPFPSSPEGGERLYRTGDLARWRPGGRIEFLGRVDRQVKIRGFRVEPAEIEAVLSQHPEVGEAAVVVRDDLPGGRGLVGYVAPALPADLRDFLRARLPEPMVPVFLASLPELPLTPNGKVDRGALARRGPVPGRTPALERSVPRTPLEEKLAGIWSEVLGLGEIGVDDNFFELGGHSLLAVQVLSRISESLGIDLRLSDLFEEPTVAGLARRMSGAALPRKEESRPSPAQPEGPRAEPLSFAQQRLWLTDLLAPGSALYNLTLAVRLTGDLAESTLLRSLAEIVRRHEPLRTVFPRGEGEPVQLVLPPPEPSRLEAARIDLSSLPGEKREVACREAIRREAGRPFDLARGPVARFALLRLGSREHVLLVNVHHVAADGWSMGVLFQELAALYRAFLAGRPSPLPELPLRYADFARWQRRELEGEALQGQLAWWRRELSGVPALELPTARPRPAFLGHRGASRSFVPAPDLTARLRALAPAEGVTLFVALLGGFTALLARLSGQCDFAVGVPSAGRDRLETEGLIGFFVNTLALRSRLEDDPPFLDLLRRTRDAVVAAQENQDVPFDRVVEELQVERDPSRSPLFQVMFAFLSVPPMTVRLPGLHAELLDIESETAKFDLTLVLREREGLLSGWMDYRTDLFDAAAVDRILGHLGVLLEGAVADPGRRLSELPLLTSAERSQLLTEGNRTGEPLPRELFHELVEERARRTPGAPAVSFGGEVLTYAGLNARANRLARHLRAAGAGPEMVVGIHLERSIDLVVAVLGVLKAGGAWLPLDPSHPPARLAFLLEDAGARLVVTHRDPFENVPSVLLDRDAATIAEEDGADLGLDLDPRHLAYVLYTSGSTGSPKGVAVSHQGLANLAAAQARRFGIGPGDRVLQFAPLSFDASVSEMVMTWWAGAELCLARSEEMLPGEPLVELVKARRITCATLPPSSLAVLPPAELPALRVLIVAGEACPPDLAACWARGRQLFNAYGPTEATVCATAGQITGGSPRLPLGQPIANVRVYLLDRHLEPVPPGVAGEILLAGPGLARGYPGRPDLTAERFIPDPFGAEPGGRLYRTGDLGRRLSSGEREFLGRVDDQVKIRGIRIEPGEIEAVLRQHPQVREAAVVAVRGTGGEARLVAFVVAGEALSAALRDYLRGRLPEVMVPARFVRLDALPRTPSGKVDRKALPLLEPPALEAPAESGGLFTTQDEELLAGIWSDLLGTGPVGPRDDFFALGGHSLLASRAVSRVRAIFGVDLPVSALFEAPTPAALAGRVEEARREPGSASPPPIEREESAEAPLSFSQQRLWFLHQLDPEDAYHVPGALRLRGPVREDVLERTLGEIVRRHEALRTVFRTVGTSPVQIVLPSGGLKLPVVDLGRLPGAEREVEARRLLEREAHRPFDLEAGPLVRVLFLRLGGEERLLAVVMHHIVSDAWSLGIVLRELGTVYAALAAGEPPPLPELPVRYPDFARWQRRWLSGSVLEREVAHWRRTLAGAPESLELPYDRPPSAGTGTRGGRRPFELPAALYGELTGLARRGGWTSFMTLLAGFQALLARWSGQLDVVVGSPVANRQRLELEGLIGFFTNTLAMRLDLSGDPSFWELGRRVRAAALDAYAHQEVPFDKLVEELAPDRHLGRNPLFQTLLVFQTPPAKPALPGIEAELLDLDTGTAKFDLTLLLTEGDGSAAGFLEYARDLFDESTAGRMLGHLRTLLAGAAGEPGRRLSELPVLTAPEREELIAWNRPLTPEPPRLCVHEGVAAQAAKTPDAVAVIFGRESLTYRDLMVRARRLARRLRALGVGPDVPVGLFLERSLDMMVAVLGVLEAGGACLPLDPGYPAERLRIMLEDAHAPVLVTHAPLAGKVPPGAGNAVRVDEPEAEEEGPLPPSGVTPDHLCYVIYTSGSTGRPKGVAMPHAAIAAMLLWQLRTSTAGAGRTLQFTSLSFDVSFQEIFSTWWAGGTLVLTSEGVRRDPAALVRLLAEERVERLFLPFVALQQVAIAALEAEGSFPEGLREVLSAGEQLYVTPPVAELFSRLPGAELHNHYGPSETHAVTWLALTGDAARWPERPAIGVPLDHARVFLLDAGLQPVPVGVAGEVWAGGAGLARGYPGRPRLTAERFLPDPFDQVEGWKPGDRLYRTGDLARRRPDGILEFLGRRDAQVKVRGHRVELFELETALARHPAVQQAAVAVHGETSGTRRLMACVVLREGVAAPAFGELRSFLAESLPEPMIPAAWARVEALPLTPTGKLDRRELARIEPEEGADGEAYVAPRNPAEELLAAIWSEVLGVTRVGAHDDFFQLGGHSLLATQVASRIREAFGVDLPLRRIFEASTLAAMAAAVLDTGGDLVSAPPIRPVPRQGPLPLSFAQERLWFLDRLQPGGTAYSVPLALSARGHLDLPVLAAALGEVVRRHEALRTIFAERDGAPAQVVLPPGGWILPVVNLAGLPAPLRESEARRLAAAEAGRPFDLGRGPLLRTDLLRLGAEEHLLLVSMHHVVSDGWSMGILVRELKVLSEALREGRPSPLPELPVQYADFAVWQRSWLAGEVLERQLAWWKERLRGAPAALDLATDRPRPAVQSPRGAEHRFSLGPDLSRRVAEISRREGVTPFMTLAAGLFALLARLTGQQDLVAGSPIANRNRREIEDLIGFFVNTLALRANTGRAPAFRDLLRQVREVSLGAYAHQDLPFEKLVEDLHPDRDLSRSPVFQVLLALQNAPLPKTDLGGLLLEPLDLPSQAAKVDLCFALAEEDGTISGSLQYAADLFDAPTAVRLTRQLVTLLAEAAAQPLGRLLELPLTSEAERHQMLQEWNDTAASFDERALLHGLFEARVEVHPDALAVVHEGEEITYGELDARANRLAGLLRRLGAGPSAPVGVWMERSPDMLTAVLGILKAGSAYLPLDASWPVERVETILAGTGARILVTGSSRLAAVQEIQWRLPELGDVVCLDVETPRPAPEPVDVQEVRGLWDFIAGQAVDRVTAGGFVHTTGEPFSEAEVDEYRDRVLSLASPWIGPDKRVLEIGSGSGLIFWEIAPRVAQFVGLDPSERTQEKNRETARREGLGHVELPTGFAHEIEGWPEGSFDLVILASTVQFFPGPFYLQRVLELALRLLAPGGAVLVADVLSPQARKPGGRELIVDEGFFHDLPADVRVFHRTEGFANELRFRYDIVLTKGDGAAPAKRLWTGWHVASFPAERPEPGAAGPEDVAYIIHTSGSTGTPKGIVVQHRPVVNLIRWVNETFGVGPGDRLLFITSLCFDLSVYDVFGMLAAGGTVHVASESALRDPERLLRTLTGEPVTIWNSAPAALQRLAPLFPPPGAMAASPLRLVLLSGDWIPIPLPDQVRAAFPGARVVSLGGATEASVWSNWYAVGEVDPDWPSIPYGRPIANARYHVLDEGLGPSPIGVPGALYIGGGCLCVGYARAPEVTAEKLVPDPFSGRPGARLYATGDRARYRPDGNLEFLGRLDFQVKVRGYRIELEEIEAALLRHPQVREAVALAREDVQGDKRLVAYVVPAHHPAPAAGELRAVLQQVLPEYMVPWTFVVLEALPLTLNGKVDRRALPAPQDAAERGGAWLAPRNELERAIGAVWQEVLGVPRIGVHDNFFESGGSSLLIAKLHSRLKSAVGLDIPVMELFRYPTIEALARKLAGEPRPEAPQEKLEAARARTRGRHEALRQMSQARAKRRGRDE